MPTPDVRGRRAQRVAAAAVALTALGGGLTAYGLAQQETEQPPPAAVTEGGHAGHHGTGPAASPGTGDASHHGMNHGAAPRSAPAYARPRGDTLRRSRPTAVRIPSLDVSGRVIDLGLQPDGTMEVPSNGTDIGWFTGSPTPGELGPAILAAHVTHDKAPAVFFELGAMRPGQRIEVDRADGSTATFAMTDVGQYPKAEFPTDRVYGEVDHAGLRLITCGGRFDGETGHHVDNVVVYAELVDGG